MVVDLKQLDKELWAEVLKEPEGEGLCRYVAGLIIRNRIDQELNPVCERDLELELIAVQGLGAQVI